MNVLFVIGNGFDLQLGLPTSYRDFYKYYCRITSFREPISQLKNDIKENYENWSDLELSLGKYTGKITNLKDFTDAYDDIQSKLRDYLMVVDSMVEHAEIKLNCTQKSFYDGFRNPENYFLPEVKDLVGSYFNDLFEKGYSPIADVNVLSFNYTHTFEHFFNMPNSEEYNDGDRHIRKIIHLHKELSDGRSIWLGVDDESQIVNELFRNEDDVVLRLVKPRIINAMGTDLDSNVSELIASADLICLFGASLGATDSTWVKKIGQRIIQGIPTLYFVREPITFNSDNERLIYQKRFRKSFIDKLKNLDLQVPSNLQKLFVEVNSLIFTDGSKNHHDENLQEVLYKLS